MKIFLRSAQAASPQRDTELELKTTGEAASDNVSALGLWSAARGYVKSAQAASPQRDTEQELKTTGEAASDNVSALGLWSAARGCVKSAQAASPRSHPPKEIEIGRSGLQSGDRRSRAQAYRNDKPGLNGCQSSVVRGYFNKLVLVMLLTIACAWPDIVPPPVRGERIKMRVVQDSVAAGGPVLDIPARLLRQHAALLDIAPRFPGRDSGGIRMLAAGVLLSAAIFLFGRAAWKRRERKRLPLVFAFVSLFAAGAMIRTASADDNGRYDAGTLNAIGVNAPYEGTVAVRVISDGDTVVLHLTPPRRPNFRPRPGLSPEPKSKP